MKVVMVMGWGRWSRLFREVLVRDGEPDAERDESRASSSSEDDVKAFRVRVACDSL